MLDIRTLNDPHVNRNYMVLLEVSSLLPIPSGEIISLQMIWTFWKPYWVQTYLFCYVNTLIFNIGSFQQIVNDINETIILCHYVHPKIWYKHWLVYVDLNSFDIMMLTRETSQTFMHSFTDIGLQNVTHSYLTLSSFSNLLPNWKPPRPVAYITGGSVPSLLRFKMMEKIVTVQQNLLFVGVYPGQLRGLNRKPLNETIFFQEENSII